MNKKHYIYDAVVVGGGSSGIAAAIGAAQTGAKTLLIERYPFFGGQATNCSIVSYCGFFTQADPYEKVVAGVGQMILDKLADINGRGEPYRTAMGNIAIPFEQEAAKFAMDSCLQEAGVHCLLHTQVIGADVINGKIKQIECVEDGGRFTVEASSFIDATGEGNLTALADGNVYVPEVDEMQIGTLIIRFGGLAAGITVRKEDIKQAVVKAKEIGIAPLTREIGSVLSIPGSADLSFVIASEKVNGLSALSLTQSEMSARKQARAYLEAFRRFLPGFENATLVQTGPRFGVRETRHTIGEYVLTVEDVLKAKRFEDSVARNGWPVERHASPGTPMTYQYIENKSYCNIPLRSLKVKGVTNLWSAGRNISCDLGALASIRVMGTSFGTGHAAGVAAAICGESYYEQKDDVRKELIRQGALI